MNNLFKEAEKANRGNQTKHRPRSSILAGLLAGAAGAAALPSLYYGLGSGGAAFSIYKGLPLMRRLSLAGKGFLKGVRYPFALMRHARSWALTGVPVHEMPPGFMTLTGVLEPEIKTLRILSGLGGIGGAAGGIALTRRKRRTK